MHSSIEFVRLAPELRRFARVVTGDQTRGDRLVTATLELTSKTRLECAELRPRLLFLRALSDLWLGDFGTTLRAQDEGRSAEAFPIDPSKRRYAYLLKAIAGLTSKEIGFILRRDPQAAEKLVQEAEQALNDTQPASVLIIEDELFVATDLETIVEDLGHRVVGVATTSATAIELARDQAPNLILSDVQLADGTSGVDAAKQIAAFHQAPTVFITAYPERLLTGQGNEPTYLIEKPFQIDDVRANMAQALYITKHQLDAL